MTTNSSALPSKPTLFCRLKIPENLDDPIELSPEYLTILAAQAKASKPNDADTTMVLEDNLVVPVDYIENLIEARWNAERQRCNAECKAQLLELKIFTRAR
ncbi:hypothetical protein DFJ58DRAFT_732591 [Suillus subalutaceus]|uniref:uncharacterized protein n=1 Tax=Suillus subalutaceus TaxID=48586 RepID=UPI001B86655A|nr:uncharacterized protein DFJ58DRAFT_732591 [Suillus subalutaceus]KAG1841138.1 hypothetical protein DFJ58DRAFT_732591 [Suillus subalutaceus]